VLFDLQTQNSLSIGPRFGATYALTADEKNIVRANWDRIGDLPQRLYLATAGNGAAGYTDYYDTLHNGLFSTDITTPAVTTAASNEVIDPKRTQTYVDEWLVGYGRQFPGQVSLDVSFVHRAYKDRPGKRRDQRHLYGRRLSRISERRPEPDLSRNQQHLEQHVVQRAGVHGRETDQEPEHPERVHARMEPSRGDLDSKRSCVVHPAECACEFSRHWLDPRERAKPLVSRRQLVGNGRHAQPFLDSEHIQDGDLVSGSVEPLAGEQLLVAFRRLIGPDRHDSPVRRSVWSVDTDTVERPGRVESAGDDVSICLCYAERRADRGAEPRHLEHPGWAQHQTWRADPRCESRYLQRHEPRRRSTVPDWWESAWHAELGDCRRRQLQRNERAIRAQRANQRPVSVLTPAP
jgi:hypothetical protein